MGSAEPRSFSRGKRGVAGTMVFTIFDRDALLDGLAEHVAAQKSFQRIGGTDMYNLDRKTPLAIEEWDSAMTKIATNGTAGVASEDAETITRNIAQTATPVYADEIPPFDITISFANEYGQKAVIVIYGVEILNEGSGFSIDNVTSEKACTFVARRVDYMKAVDRTNNASVVQSKSNKSK